MDSEIEPHLHLPQVFTNMAFLECGEIFLDPKHFFIFSSSSGGITIGSMIGSGSLLISAVVGVGACVFIDRLPDNIIMR